MRDRYAVLGNPVEHSLSPQIHAFFAQQFGETIDYRKIRSDKVAFEGTLEEFFKQKGARGAGLNITLPFKETAYRWVDELSEAARQAGAVNTISIHNEKVVGHNTDGSGLVRDLCVNHGLSLLNSNVLILGAGGATRGIFGPLLQAGARITLANRTLATATKMLQGFVSSGLVEVGAVSVCALDTCAGQYGLVINATSAGVSGEALEIAPVCKDAFCYDLFYQLDQPTAFCLQAMSRGATSAVDGLGMLVEQAAESYKIWRGVRPETVSVIRTLRNLATAT